LGACNMHRICTMAQRFNSPSDAVAFGDRLRAARVEARMTLVDMQEAVGVDHSQISRIERGCAVTMSANVQKLSKWLRVALPVSGAASGGDLARRVQALARSTPAAADALAAMVNALESLATERR
jgi:transcriptional regulator with XRE-family HTH domain